MKNLHGNKQWWLIAALMGSLSLTGCGGGGGGAASTTPPPGTDPTTTAATLQGNLVTDVGVPPLDATETATPVAVLLFDATPNTTAALTPAPGTPVASQILTAGTGTFSLAAEQGHTYAVVFRAGSATGRTMGVMLVNRANSHTGFSVPSGTTEINLGAITLDSSQGKAWGETDPTMPGATLALADTDGEGIPDIADQTTDEDGDGVLDGVDARPFLGKSNIPTDNKPSPLYGAQSFTQQMLLFEEFGTEPLPAAAAAAYSPLPAPVNPQSGPEPTALESFLAQTGIAPYPSRLSNVVDANPWKASIEAFLGRTLITPANGTGVAGPAEGRPSGEGWAHQRWEEFYPQVYYKTAQAGARVNGGFRDTRQRHGYAVGEFAPGGLYHNTAGIPATAGTTRGIGIRFHPNMPVQEPNAIWTFDGTLPPKLLMARYGEAILMRHYNALPLDETANLGFGMHTISTHEHNGHSPAESDGYTGAYFYPGQFTDYRWPIQLAGYDTINKTASEPRAAFPCAPGERLMVDSTDDGIANPTMKECVNGRIQLRGDWRETMSTHWFHDHMLDFTSDNVYKGNAVMMNYYSALDRGNESVNDGVNLRFPSGTALPWGNRDYDINLVVADKAWGQTKAGQLWFNSANTDGFLGDQVLVNWLYHPYLDVRARSYRFRILNGAVSRYFSFALVQQVQGTAGEIPGPANSGVSYNRVPFHMIANDGNILEHAVPFDGSRNLNPNNADPLDNKGRLPTQGIAERYDIIVDFSKHGIKPGDKLYFVNVVEHQDGKGIKGRVPLADILSERYKAEALDSNGDGVADSYINGDPAVGKFLELRVHAYAGVDQSMNPVDYEPGKLKMIPLAIDRTNTTQLANAPLHTFEFVRSQGGSIHPWRIKVDGGAANFMDTARISALVGGQIERWTIGGGGGWDHPVHVHFEEGVILSRDGKAPPEWEKWARKDLYRIGRGNESSSSMEVAFRARDFIGSYMSHCHNTTHEDHAMLLRWDINSGQLVPLPSPVAGWDGVGFRDSFLDGSVVMTGH